jgi:DNA-binding transcriptional regulator YiaG
MKKWTPKEIIAFRKKCELSQRAFGESLGVVKNYIYYLERGERIPSKTLRILLSLLEEKQKAKKERG